MTTATEREFATRLLEWHAHHGRHDLPWQQQKSAYRVWISEIMLQQTQVATVIPYFERFIARFPCALALADAAEDEVLHHWTGLGYYARARNLHHAARTIRDQFFGVFPRDVATLSTLPGIGRSTAGAICAIAFNQRAPILDGNVKRVLARFYAIDVTIQPAAALRRLWLYAEQLTPDERPADYTQAIMDLGATVCTRTRPACTLCPLKDGCRGHAEGNPQRYPGRKASHTLPERHCQMLVIRNALGEFLLEKRPPNGIWGGLWSFPQIEADIDPTLACDRLAGTEPLSLQRGQSFRHTFSHFHLDATPIFVAIATAPPQLMEDKRLIWYKPGAQALGFAAPVKRLIDTLSAHETAEPEMF